MQQIYRRALSEVALQIAPQRGCSPVNFPHIFRTAFPKKTSGRLLLKIAALKFKKVENTANNMCSVEETIQKLNVAIFSVN